jgi:hypothetical protein
VLCRISRNKRSPAFFAKNKQRREYVLSGNKKREVKKMSSIRRIAFLSLFVVAILLLQNTGEASVGGTSYKSGKHTFGTSERSFTVGGRVYRKTSDLFMDICQVSHQDFAVELNLFAVEISEGIDASLPNMEGDPTHDYVDPAFWSATDSLVRDADLPFGHTFDLTEQSVPLWFVGDHATTSDRQNVVLAESIRNTALTCTDPRDDAIRIAAPAWAVDF